MIKKKVYEKSCNFKKSLLLAMAYSVCLRAGAAKREVTISGQTKVTLFLLPLPRWPKPSRSPLQAVVAGVHL